MTKTLVLALTLSLPACISAPVATQDSDTGLLRILRATIQELEANECERRSADVDVGRGRVRVNCE